ncbi:head-tail connector protein [Pseudomonas syringae]|uniref:head-tail connector protein n=1 Tax=Pseudomonas syringae TaxID=317 RepID=UPI003F78FE8D
MTVSVVDLLTIELMRKHLRVDQGDDDDLIMLYAESALEWALWYCDNPQLVVAADFKASFKAALLLLIGHSYNSREAVIVGTIAEELPLAVESLLWSSRNLQDAKDLRVIP